jgi:hypothetical protein
MVRTHHLPPQICRSDPVQRAGPRLPRERVWVTAGHAQDACARPSIGKSASCGRQGPRGGGTASLAGTWLISGWPLRRIHWPPGKAAWDAAIPANSRRPAVLIDVRHFLHLRSVSLRAGDRSRLGLWSARSRRGWPCCPLCELVPGEGGQFRSDLHGEVGEPIMPWQRAQARLRQRAGGVGVAA